MELKTESLKTIPQALSLTYISILPTIQTPSFNSLHLFPPLSHLGSLLLCEKQNVLQVTFNSQLMLVPEMYLCISWCPELPAWVPLSLRASSFRSSEIDEVPFPMLVRIPHHNCEQSGALRRCVPKLEFGNKEQLT